MNTIEKMTKCGIVLVCLAGLPSPAFAQTAEPANAQAMSEVPVLEEVLVTATRRVESLQDVPMSVSAFSEQFLQDSGLTQLNELDEYTPNLRITTATAARSFLKISHALLVSPATRLLA